MLNRCAALCLFSILAACGGGGGGDAPAPAPSLSVPLATAVANFVNRTQSSPVTVNGSITSGGQTFTLGGSGTLSESTSSSTFEGQAALRKNSTMTGTLTANGQSAPMSDTSQMYFDTNYRPLGDTSDTSYCVVTSATPIPVTAKAGDNGPWYTETCYTNGSKSVSAGTGSISYAVEPDTASTVILKIIAQTSVATGVTLPVTSIFRVDTSGQITRLQDLASFALAGEAFTLTVTYR
jgi:hypothetical protein